MEVFGMEQELQELRVAVAALADQLRIQNELLAAKDAQIAALTEKIAELTTKLEEKNHKKNSGNSSTPPSSDRFEKPAPKSLREKSGRKPGGQPGHKGKGMKLDRKPDEVISHIPEKCQGCPKACLCTMKCCETRYEYEAVVQTKLIAHKVMKCTCPLSGHLMTGTFPANITGTKQYGAGVAALATSLFTVGYMSVDRIQKLLNSLRIPISTGTVQNIVDSAALSAKEPVNSIRQKVIDRDITNFDETGLRVAKKLHWLHCACSGPWRFYTVQERRGEKGIDAMGVLPNKAGGVATHDFWKPYHKYENVEHAMCGAHLERELVYAAEIGKQAWAKKLRKLLQLMCHRRNELMADNQSEFPATELQEYLDKYDRIVARGMKVNPIPERKPGQRGRLKKGKIRSLLERFRDFKEDVLRFTKDWRVPFTNNDAERAIRFARMKEKVSGCFRTKKGADQFACMLSFISTAVAHGVSSFDACLSLHNHTALSFVQSWVD